MLHGKRIVIAGASRGIGAAAARAFAQDGAVLALGARSAEDLARLAADLPQVRFHAACDFTDADAATHWAAGAVAGLGGVDGVLITLTAARATSSAADLAASLSVDVSAAIAVFRALQPALVQSRGTALFCSSRTVSTPVPTTLAYGSAKAALEYAVRCLAAETLADGIRVNAVAPGSTLTEDGFWADEAARDTPHWGRTMARLPQGRMARPAEIIAPMAFLLSDRAAWITGQTLLVDGGQTLFAHLPA